MPWWKKPFTLMIVPHDGSETFSFTFRGLTLFLATFVFSVLVGFGTFFTLSAFTSSPMTSLESSSQQKIAELRQQNRRYQKLEKSIQTLRSKLRRTEQLQRSILKLNGIEDPSRATLELRAVSLREDDGTKTKIDKTQRSINNQIKRNKKLETIKQFVKNRNEVFEHTPVLWPVDGWLSSSYGYRKDPMGGQGREFHRGVDLAAWHRSPIRSPANGKVVFSGYKGGYGQVVKIRHEYGYSTLYGHLNERHVKKGEAVTKGQVIGRVGSSGHSTGSHLHYEVRINGEAINPWPYLVQEYESFQSLLNQEAVSDAGN